MPRLLSRTHQAGYGPLLAAKLTIDSSVVLPVYCTIVAVLAIGARASHAHINGNKYFLNLLPLLVRDPLWAHVSISVVRHSAWLLVAWLMQLLILLRTLCLG